MPRADQRSGAFFGEPWPSGVCEEMSQVPTPVGETCHWCDETIVFGDQGTFVGTWHGPQPMHRECSLRSVIGSLACLQGTCTNCGDGTAVEGELTLRQDALAVWQWVQTHGIPA